MGMLHSFAYMLSDDDAPMRQHGLRQPPEAEAAWRSHVMPPMETPPFGLGLEQWRWSERMVFYVSTRTSYSPDQELTIDYGVSCVSNSLTRHCTCARF